jgi:membrane dipeptidase
VPFADIGDPVRKSELLPRYAASGVNFVSLSIGGDNAGIAETIRLIARERRRLLAEPARYLLASGIGDIERARREGRLATLFHFQGTDSFEGDLGMVETYYRLGVRHALLAYNTRNRVADGCMEPGNAGLSAFGRRLIAEMNAVGMLVDCSHTGERSSREAMDCSTQPVIFSHSNASAVFAHPRNISDVQIRACAATGGVVGIMGVGAMLGSATGPLVDALVAHIDHCVTLVGPQHVGVSLDFVYDAEATYRTALAWAGGKFPEGSGYRPDMPMVEPEQFPQIGAELLSRGYPVQDVRGILGENWLRVGRQVWR